MRLTCLIACVYMSKTAAPRPIRARRGAVEQLQAKVAELEAGTIDVSAFSEWYEPWSQTADFGTNGYVRDQVTAVLEDLDAGRITEADAKRNLVAIVPTTARSGTSAEAMATP